MAARRALLLVGEENAGLTTALDWLTAEAYGQQPELAPVLVDFKQLGSGNRPLDRQLRRELLGAAALGDRRDPLPPCALAIDNALVQPSRIFARMLEELTIGGFPFLVLGCRLGDEAELTERASAAGLELTVRYLGPMRLSDARALAGLVEPTRADGLADKAMAIVQREHLPRTPLTFGLLFSVLLHGESLLGTASETALLDAYVNLLLGRGDPHDDARFQLDSLEKTDILATLAAEHVQAKAGSLPEAKVIATLASYFEAVGWSEDPFDALATFKARHLLTVRSGKVRFSQSSFLHLFAAKRAMEDHPFRQLLYEEPLRYAPIIKHYAALTRNDPEVLRKVRGLLGPFRQPEGAPDGTFGDVLPLAEVNTVDDLVGLLNPDRGSSEGAPSEQPDVHAQVAERYEVLLEEIDDGDADPDPFPLDDLDNASEWRRFFIALTLVSNVLRDSELVKDLNLKREVLMNTLEAWGSFVAAVERDDSYIALMTRLARELSEVLAPPGRRDDFVEDFVESAPMLTGMGGMSATLASRKLTRLIEECFSDEDFCARRYQAVMGALLAFDLQQPGWPGVFMTVFDRHSTSKALRVVLRRLAQTAYFSPSLRDADTGPLNAFLSHVYAAQIPTKVSKNELERIAQSLRDRRALELRRRAALPGPGLAGDRVIQGELA